MGSLINSKLVSDIGSERKKEYSICMANATAIAACLRECCSRREEKSCLRTAERLKLTKLFLKIEKLLCALKLMQLYVKCFIKYSFGL